MIIFTLKNQKWLPSQINETNQSTLNGSKSLFVDCTLTTTNTRLSPVIDTSRISAFKIQNRINSPTSLNTIS